MAWVKANPANDELLINFPAQCRANWDALELLTDNAIQITNAKVADSAGITDGKLAQIATPSKVSGAALTLLGNIPGGAGLVPVANIPNLSTDKLTSGTLPIARGGTGSGTQNFVDLTEGQSVGGIKTFTSIPILPASDPTTDNQVVRKAYVNTQDATKISKTIAGEIAGMTEKVTLVDNDLFIIEDSADSNNKKKVKKSNVVSAVVISGVFGAWTNAVINVNTQVTTDGFIVGYVTASADGQLFTIKTDAASTPTTIRCSILTQGNSYGSCFCVPVKKNNYYRTSSLGTITAYWIPLGT